MNENEKRKRWNKDNNEHRTALQNSI